jgi:hypothetical protein
MDATVHRGSASIRRANQSPACRRKSGLTKITSASSAAHQIKLKIWRWDFLDFVGYRTDKLV